VANASRIHFGFRFIVNPDTIIEYAPNYKIIDHVTAATQMPHRARM